MVARLKNDVRTSTSPKTRRVKQVTRSPKGKRLDDREATPRAKAAKERRERKLNTKRYRNVPVKTKPKPKSPVKPKGGIADKAAKKSLLRKYGIPLGVISSILAGSTLLNKNEKVAKKVVAKPAAKKEEPMKRRFRAGPTAGSGLGGQRRSGTLRGKNVVANPPKPRNKNVTKRPKGPSKQGSFGRQMRASRGMGIIMPSKCCSKVLSRPSTVNTKRKTKCRTKKRS